MLKKFLSSGKERLENSIKNMGEVNVWRHTHNEFGSIVVCLLS